MPHLRVEYSSNLERAIDMPALLKALHLAAIDTGVFPVGGTRTRAQRVDQYVIADQHPDNGFVHVEVRIGPGRTDDVKTKASSHIFAALKAATVKYMAEHPLAISLDLVEMSEVGAQKHNNLHEHVALRQKT